MKYISSHGEPFLGKRFEIIAESEEEAKALKIVYEVIGMIPHFCGLAIKDINLIFAQMLHIMEK